MGTYLNPGINSFEEAVNSEIFVDKTEMLCYLNSVLRTKQKYVSVSRPRRFGKTMAADMICAYYDRTADSRALFEGCKLSLADETGWGKYLCQFLVGINYDKTASNDDIEFKHHSCNIEKA